MFLLVCRKVAFEAKRKVIALQSEIWYLENGLVWAWNALLRASEQEQHTWRASPAAAGQEFKCGLPHPGLI